MKRRVFAALCVLGAAALPAACTPGTGGTGGGPAVTATCTQVNPPVRIGNTITGIARTTCTFSQSIALVDVKNWLYLDRTNNGAGTVAATADNHGGATITGTTFELLNIVSYDAANEFPGTHFQYGVDVYYRGAFVTSTYSTII